MTKKTTITVTIQPPNIRRATFTIEGTTPLIVNAFSSKAKMMIRETQEAGSTSKKGKKREPKDFQALYEGAKHISQKGWCGIAASAFRCALISACRICGFQMTKAKLAVFIEADGFDKEDGTPLVQITKGEPHYSEHPVRLEKGGCDIRARPMWDSGWQAELTVRFDADQFTLGDVTNLLHRVGLQVGIGEGRPDSKKSAGMGWGLFNVLPQKKGAKVV